MNRMAPLVRRRIRNEANFRFAAERPLSAVLAPPATWAADAKLFAAGWVGGLVVFGTLLA